MMEPELKLYFPEVEREVISNILQTPTLLYEAQVLTEDTFTDRYCRDAWRVICDNEKKGLPYDYIAIAPLFSSLGMDIPTFLQYFEGGGSNINFARNVAILNEYAYRRRLRLELSRMINRVSDPGNSIEEIQREGFDVFNSIDNIGSIETYTNISDVAQKLVEDAVRRQNDAGLSTTVQTGFSFLDNACGLKEGHLMVIAAESSMGKTSFATDIAVNVSMSGHPTLFFSLEMNDREVVSRVMARYADLKSGFITDGCMETSQIERLRYAARCLSQMKLIFDDKERFNVNRMCASIRRAVKRKGIRLVIIDYLQIFGQSGIRQQSQVEFYGEVTRRFKNLAEELKITIILVSQLNRNREHPVPTLSRLRGSGEIEENANEVIFVYRPERLIDAGVTAYPDEFCNVPVRGTAMIILAKCRGGECGRTILNFDGRTTHFYERNDNNKDNVPQRVEHKVEAHEEVLPF